MAAADWRVAAELLEYYRRAAYEAGVLYPRQTITPPTEPTPTPTTTTTTTTTSSSTSSSSSSSTSSSISTSSTSSSSSRSSTQSSTSSTISSTESSSSSVPESISSVVTTTIVTTNSNGQSVTTVEVTGTVVPNPNANNESSNVNTGAIVGGVLGGIAFILLLVGLFIWWRRKKRFDEFEANIFDPDRNIERPMSTAADPHFDLLTTAAVPEAARSITPYSYGNQPAGSVTGTGTGTGTGTAQGSSVGGQPEVRPPSSYYAYDNVSSAGGTHYPPSAAGTDALPNPYDRGFIPPSLVPGAIATGAGAGAFGAAALNRGQTVSSTTSSSYYPQSAYSHPTSYPPSHGSPKSPQFPQQNNQPIPVPMPVPAPLNPRAAKEREAFQRTHGNGGLSVANQGADSPGSGREGVVVHQDGGRVNIPEEDEDPRDAEIPPTYDSIRQEGHGAPAPSALSPAASPASAPAMQPATGNQ